MAIGFAVLEERIDAAIAEMLRIDERSAAIVVAEMSYKAKVHVLASLVQENAQARSFNTAGADPVAVFRELAALLFRAEAFRNSIMHSSWSHVPGSSLRTPAEASVAKRLKRTAKAHHGYRIVEGMMTGAALLDIYDFMLNVEDELDSFFIDPS